MNNISDNKQSSNSNSLEPLKPVQELLARKLNRKEFLSVTGFGALTALGLAPMIKFLTGKSSPVRIIRQYRKSGFGSGRYGGVTS